MICNNKTALNLSGFIICQGGRYLTLTFPRRKTTINRVRELDRSSREEAKIKAADHKAHGYKPEMTEVSVK